MKKEHTAASLRYALKAELGYNARQVTVSKRSSETYLILTVRDPLVDLAKVDEFAKVRHTWHMDNTDYCTGQSVHVQTTKEVDAAHAAPWMKTVLALLPELDAMEEESCLSLDAIRPGLFIWLDRCDFRVELKHDRRCYRRRSDVLSRESYAIEALALDIARLLEKHPLDLPEWMEEIDEAREAAPFAPASPEPAPEPENVVQFQRPAAPAPVASERVPVYEDKPRHFTQQRMVFAENDLFALR